MTRPGIEIPDRKALNIESHFEAAKGAYLIKDYEEGEPKEGVVLIRGTSPTANLIKVLPEILNSGPNVKIVAAISLELFDLQSEDYKKKVYSESERLDSMIITNGSIGNMAGWSGGPQTNEYSLSSDFDNRWRTGGSLEEVIEEAHLSPHYILDAIKKFASNKDKRIEKIRSNLNNL